MAKERTNKKKVTGSNERGITPSKVAYAYGVSLETLQKWISGSSLLMVLKDQAEVNDDFSFNSRKWTPKQLQYVFKEFGDPREYSDIIDSSYIP